MKNDAKVRSEYWCRICKHAVVYEASQWMFVEETGVIKCEKKAKKVVCTRCFHSVRLNKGINLATTTIPIIITAIKRND